MGIHKQFTGLDFGVMILYVLTVIGIGAWISFRERGSGGHLFLAQQSLGRTSIGLNMWGTNVGPSMLIASAGAGYSTGIVAGNFSWYAFPFILLLALVFAPRYLGQRVTTLPEFIGLRFGNGARELLAWYSLVTIVVSWLGMTLYSGAVLASQVMGWPLWLSVVVLVAVSAFLAIGGGLRAVAGANVFQMVVLIVASAALVVAGLVALNGPGRLFTELPADRWNLLQPAHHAEFPWPAVLLGYPVLGVWFWCTDQSMVQSVLGARSLKEGQLGANLTGWLKIADVPLFILPGMICFLLFPGLAQEEDAYMTMVSRLLPQGMVGLIVVTIVAALVSTISSALNSLGTVFTMDIWVKRFRPAAEPREIIHLGRLVALAGAALSVFLALGIGELKDLAMFSLFQSILGFLAPPITAVFLMGVLWRRATTAGALAVLGGGSVVSLGTGVLYLTSANKDAWPHFLLLSFYLCVALCGLMVVVSLLTSPRQAAPAAAVPARAVYPRPERTVVVAWVLLVAVMLALYALFA